MQELRTTIPDLTTLQPAMAPTERFINPCFFIIVSLQNDNMVNYTFTTEQGWKVTEYRPFSASYAVLHSPCMPDKDYRNSCSRPDSDTVPTDRPGASNMLATLTNQQLKFNYFSKDVLRQLLEERVTIRNRNRSSILGRLSDLSGEIYGASMLRTPEAEKQRQGLEKTRMDMERQLGEEDATLWRDSLELRRELILADKTYESSQFRKGLMSALPSSDDSKGQTDTSLSG
jgi:hypothetical protein